MSSDVIVRRVTWLVGAAMVVIGAVLIPYVLQFSHRFSNEQADWGQFGDYMGGTLNPILSFCTLIALAITVVLQVRQLEHSREELQATRQELARTSEAQREAATALKAQLEHAELLAHWQKKAAEYQAGTAQAMQQQAQYASITARVQALSAAIQGLSGPDGMNGGEIVEALRQATYNKSHSTSSAQQVRMALLRDLLRLADEAKDPHEHA